MRLVMVGMARNSSAVIAVGAIVLLLCGGLCLFDDDGGGVDLCLLTLAVATAVLGRFALEPAGQLVPALAGAAYPTPTETRPPPPKR